MHALTSEEGWLFKVDANGIVQSSKTYGKKLKLSCATETEDSGYIIGGGFNARDSFNLPYLLRVDQKGAGLQEVEKGIESSP